jgi:hypothetical protein
MMNTELVKTCEKCQKSFIATKLTQKYCSFRCQHNARAKRYYDRLRGEVTELKTNLKQEIKEVVEEKQDRYNQLIEYGNSHPEQIDRLRNFASTERLELEIMKAPTDRDIKQVLKTNHEHDKIFDECYSITVLRCQECGRVLFRGHPVKIKSRFERQGLYFWLKKKYKF